MLPGFGCGAEGGMADYVIVDDPRHLVPLGDLDPVAAAPLMCAGITTYHAVSAASPRLDGTATAVVIGVGGLGHLAIQILKTLTMARIVGVDRNQEKLDHARSVGADDVRGVHAGIAKTVEKEVAEHVGAEHPHELRLRPQPRGRNRDIGRRAAGELQERARRVRRCVGLGEEIDQRFAEADDLHARSVIRTREPRSPYHTM